MTENTVFNMDDEKPYSILVVDDDEAVANSLKDAVELIGIYSVTVAKNGKDAFEQAKNKSFDAYLVDQKMPEMTGTEFIRELKEIQNNLLIYIITAEDDGVALKEAENPAAEERLPIKRYIPKPWPRSLFSVDLREDLRERDLIKELSAAATRYSEEQRKIQMDFNCEMEKIRAREIDSARMVSIGKLATSMAHELNQPLQTFKFTLHNIRQRLDDESLDKDFLVMKTGKLDELSDYMDDVVTSLRGYAKPDDECSYYSLNSIIDSVLSILGRQLADDHVFVHQDYPEDLRVYGNRSSLMQVFVNLFGNSRDAYRDLAKSVNDSSEKYEVLVTAELIGSKLNVHVKDDAGGIQESIRDRVFEPFVSTKQSGKGTGMGLYIVYKIMTGLSGDANAIVDEARGTTFNLVFPNPDDKEEESKNE